MITEQQTVNLDEREALYNEQAKGPAHQIQLPAERVTRLHGILFDHDSNLLIPGNALFPPDEDPEDFYSMNQTIIDRHPLARFAEVRASGTGLHLILWLQPAVELTSAAEQQRWRHIVRVVQCSLPTDPDAPGITALTRPIGSVNSKNGAVVKILKPGTPIDPCEVEAYMARIEKAPFKEVALVLLGKEHVSPCPVCKKDGTTLNLGDHMGFCYGSCSKYKLDRLFDGMLKPVEPSPSSGESDEIPPHKPFKRLRKELMTAYMQNQNARLQALRRKSTKERS